MLECVKRILDSKPCEEDEIRAQFINLQAGETKRTALHMCMIAGNEELAEYLLAKGGDPFLVDKYNYNILHLAIQNGKNVKKSSFFGSNLS